MILIKLAQEMIKLTVKKLIYISKFLNYELQCTQVLGSIIHGKFIFPLFVNNCRLTVLGTTNWLDVYHLIYSPNMIFV